MAPLHMTLAILQGAMFSNKMGPQASLCMEEEYTRKQFCNSVQIYCSVRAKIARPRRNINHANNQLLPPSGFVISLDFWIKIKFNLTKNIYEL